MDWQKERDALINETMALVERVGITKPKAAVEAQTATPAEPTVPDRQAGCPMAFMPIQWESSEREHIAKRIENFRAHQERVRREREEYFFRTMQRARENANGRTDD